MLPSLHRLSSRGRTRLTVALGAAGVATVAVCLAAHAAKPKQDRVDSQRAELLRADEASPGAPTTLPHIGHAGSTIIGHHDGLLVVERNAGVLVRTNANGEPMASLDVGAQGGQLVSDGKQIFYADRRGGEVVRIEAGGKGSSTIKKGTGVAVAEPYGLALTPDGSLLLATSVADHELVGIDTKTMSIRFSVPLLPEPRGVAISPDGSQASIGFVSTGSVAVVALNGTPTETSVRYQTLDPSDVLDVEFEEDDWGGWASATVQERRSRFQVPSDTGRRRARNVFALGYVGDGRLVVPHELAASQLVRRPHLDNTDNYGGMPSIPAITHRLAMVTKPGALKSTTDVGALDVHQPRALAFDPVTDTLFVGGWGDSRVMAVARASSQTPTVAWTHRLGSSKGRDCAVDGLAVHQDRLYVHCNLWREVAFVDIPHTGSEKRPELGVLADQAFQTGGETAPSLRSDAEEKGAWLFRRGRDWRLSEAGFMACASCHPEGRADGLSWRLGDAVLQTPYLAGRVDGTEPFKWSAADKSLRKSMQHTIERLGGSPDSLSSGDYDALEAFLRSLEAPQAKTVTDAEAVARGKALFTGKKLGCDGCHDGPSLTDRNVHDIGSGALTETDTPSLLGVAHSAPYYHDGSAETLEALLDDRSTVHDMADMSVLDDKQRADLVAYLETL